MDLARYLRIFQARALLIAATTIICCAVAAGVAWTANPLYEAKTDLFVTTQATASESPSEAYAGTLLAQQRVASYAELLTSSAILDAVAADVDATPADIEPEVKSSNPPGTTLLEVSVRDHSAARAKKIADAIARRFPAFVAALGASPTGGPAPVKLTITKPAELPLHPVAPRKKLALVLGAVLGVLVGIGAAVVGEALNRRVRDAADTFASSAVSTVTAIPSHRAARDQPLVMTGASMSAAAEAIRLLRTNLQSELDASEGTPVVVIASPSEGDGKTFVAVNVALAFAQAGRQVCLVDADLRRTTPGGATGLFDVTRAPGLVQVLGHSAEVDQVLRRWNNRLAIVPTGEPSAASPGELLASPEFAAALDAFAGAVNLTIVDTPGLSRFADAAAVAKHATAVVLVARAGVTRMDDFERAVEAIRNTGTPLVGTVLNAAPRRSSPVFGPSRPIYVRVDEKEITSRDGLLRGPGQPADGSSTGR